MSKLYVADIIYRQYCYHFRAVKLNEMKKEYRLSLQHDGIAENHPIQQQLQELEEENSTNRYV